MLMPVRPRNGRWRPCIPGREGALAASSCATLCVRSGGAPRAQPRGPPRQGRSGRLAQLGERRVRNAEVGSSSLLPSTNILNAARPQAARRLSFLTCPRRRHSASCALDPSSCRLPAVSSAPSRAVDDSTAVWSITRTADELSVVCDVAARPTEVRQEGPFAVFMVARPPGLHPDRHPVAAQPPLAGGRIPIFVLSTFDTDYMLVRTRTPVPPWRRGPTPTASWASNR